MLALPLSPSSQELAAPQAMVCRDGRWQELPVRELVPGDLVALKGGDVIPADCKASVACQGVVQVTPSTRHRTQVM